MPPQDWTLTVTPTPDGVELVLGLPDLDGRPTTATLRLDRGEARGFARALLAAAGDATERTFPHPPRGSERPQGGDR